MKNRKFIIPIDFTESTENALIYASQMANNASDELILLHVLDELNEQVAQANLNSLQKKWLSEFLGKVELKIISGKINEQIGNFAAALEANYIVMGIHKSSKFANLFGSKAVDVISKSKVPFIIVQNGTAYNGIKKIAMTIDLEKESIQVVKTASELANNLGAELLLVAGDHTDSELKKKVSNNLKVATDFLRKNNIQGSVKLLARKTFMDEFIGLCQDENVQLIAVTYYVNTLQVLSAKFVQHLLENDLKIPVLAVDAQAVSQGSQYSFMSI